MFENIQLAELAIGRSTVRQRILALLMAEQPTRLHLREIQRRVGTSPGTASRELARLVAAGLIEREAEGSQVYFRASQSPVAAMIRQLLLVQSGASSASPPAPGRIPRGRRVEAANAPSPASALSSANADAVAEDATGAPGAAGAAGESLAEAIPASSSESRAPDPLALVVAARFTAAVRPLYEDRLKAVFLYGARTSSSAPDDADVELLVVLDRVARYGEELERTSAVCAQLSLELGLVVSRVFVARERWTDPGPGFVAVVTDEESRP